MLLVGLLSVLLVGCGVERPHAEAHPNAGGMQLPMLMVSRRAVNLLLEHANGSLPGGVGNGEPMLTHAWKPPAFGHSRRVLRLLFI